MKERWKACCLLYVNLGKKREWRRWVGWCAYRVALVWLVFMYFVNQIKFFDFTNFTIEWVFFGLGRGRCKGEQLVDLAGFHRISGTKLNFLVYQFCDWIVLNILWIELVLNWNASVRLGSFRFGQECKRENKERQCLTFTKSYTSQEKVSMSVSEDEMVAYLSFWICWKEVIAFCRV